MLAARHGDIAAAERGYREAMEIATELGDERTLSITMTTSATAPSEGTTSSRLVAG